MHDAFEQPTDVTSTALDQAEPISPQQPMEPHYQTNSDFTPSSFNEDPYAPLQRFQADPRQNAEAEAQYLISEYRRKHPDLLDYEDYIEVEVQKMIADCQRHGRHLDPRQAIEAGIKAFRTKLGKLLENQNQAQGRVAMRLDVSQKSKPNKVTGADAIRKMSSDEFKAYDREVVRQLYGY